MEFPCRDKSNEPFHSGTVWLMLLPFLFAWLVLALRRYLAIWEHRKAPEAYARGMEDGVANRRGDGHDWCFACAGRRKVFAIQKDGFSFWEVSETRHAIA